jgi:hypothetical protein
MRTNNFLRVAALSLTLAAPLAAGLAAFTPAHASIEDTIWRDQARIAAHVAPGATYVETSPATTNDQASQVAKGRSSTATDAGPALITPPPSNDPLTDGAGLPISSKTGVELPGYNLGGF